MSILSELAQLVEPYINRGDTFANELHRLVTTIEADIKALEGGAETVPSTGEPAPASGQPEPAADQAGEAVTPVPPAEAAETAHPDPTVQDISGGGSGGTVPVEPAAPPAEG